MDETIANEQREYVSTTFLHEISGSHRAEYEFKMRSANSYIYKIIPPNTIES